MSKIDNIAKYCRDCVHWNVDIEEEPCVYCHDDKQYFEPKAIMKPSTPIARMKVETEKKHYIMDDKTNTVAEFEPEEPAKIHRRTPANLYEGIDHDLLKRVRKIMQAYYDINQYVLSDDVNRQLQHDIDIINDLVGYSLEHLQHKLSYILDCVQDIQISTNGEAMPEVNADELEAIKTWVCELDVQE